MSKQPLILTDGIEYHEPTRALITRTGENRNSSDFGMLIARPVTNNGGKMDKVMGWGSKNDLPVYRENLVAENNIVPSLLATRRDITLGRGLYTYTERYEDGKRITEEVEMPRPMREFFDANDIDDYLLTAARNLVMHGTVFTEFVRGSGENDRIVMISAKECRHVRAGEMDMDSGRIPYYYWSGGWGLRQDKATRDYPTYRVQNYDPGRTQKKFMLMTGDNLLCLDEYYFTPYWWGSESWIKLANCIPDFHEANLKHGYSIRYHIEIPKGYFSNVNFSQLSNEKEFESAKEAANSAKQLFLDKLNKFLAGASNSGRTVVTEYEINMALGKDFPGIKIRPLEIDLQDEALLKLFEKSNQAVISAQGVHPTLANIETQGKLSSGSEIRNAFLMYVAIKTPLPRKTLLKPLELVGRENGWDRSIKIGFRDMEITTLAEEPTGSRQTTNEPVSI